MFPISRAGLLAALALLTTASFVVAAEAPRGIWLTDEGRLNGGELPTRLVPLRRLFPAKDGNAEAKAFKADADSFILSAGLVPPEKHADAFVLRSILLHVSKGLRIEPTVFDEKGRATTAHARISRAQAIRIIDALAEAGFFARAVKAPDAEPAPTGPHAAISVSYQPEGGPAPIQYRLTWDWDEKLLDRFDAIGANVDGGPAAIVNALVKGLAKPGKGDDRTKTADMLERLAIIGKAILDKQIAVSDGVSALHKAIEGNGDKKPRLEDRKAALALAEKQTVVIREMRRYIDKIRAEATYFPAEIEGVYRDMRRFNIFLVRCDLGPSTQAIATDIIDALKEFLR